MDIYEKRRLAMKALVQSLGYGGIKRLADTIGKHQGLVARYLYPPDKPGAKRVGDTMVIALDKNFPGWMESVKEMQILETEPAQRVISIRQYDCGGRMGHAGLILSDQPGVIKGWNVSDDWLRLNVRGFINSNDLCIVTGFGDSMKPLFNPGDPLLVDTGVKTVSIDGCYFFRIGEEGFIKRLQRIPGDGIRAISSNSDYEPWTIRADMDFEVLGRVLKVWTSDHM